MLFGCEHWAPWSEELGRKPVLQASLFLVNMGQLHVALAPNFASIMVGRSLGDLSSARGSVTLGMIADMWESDNQQYAVAFVVFSSVGGSIQGPVVGGFVEQFLNRRWNIWIQLTFGGFVQILRLVCVTETRTTIMMDKIAKKRRKSGQEPNIYGPNELEPFRERFSAKEILITWIRPFRMFLRANCPHVVSAQWLQRRAHLHVHPVLHPGLQAVELQYPRRRSFIHTNRRRLRHCLSFVQIPVEPITPLKIQRCPCWPRWLESMQFLPKSPGPYLVRCKS
jgi:hypothetical protein